MEMKKYRKRPIIIEAKQWHKGEKSFPGIYIDENGNYYCKTLEGNLNISDGDWIIKGIEEEYYPCKAGIFEKTYEPL